MTLNLVCLPSVLIICKGVEMTLMEFTDEQTEVPSGRNKKLTLSILERLGMGRK